MTTTKNSRRVKVQFEPSRLKAVHWVDAYEKLIPLSERALELPKGKVVMPSLIFNTDKEKRR